MEQRYNDIIGNQFPFLVACERGAVIKPRRKKYEGESIILPDTILGFAIADDYNDMLGMYRFTAEVELFVHKDYYLKGVAKCLLDKMMAMLDPEYIERGGYDIEGDELEGVGQSRIIQNVIINLPYETEKPMRLEWIGKWLKNWIGFTQVADLPKVGLKDKKKYVCPYCLLCKSLLLTMLAASASPSSTVRLASTLIQRAHPSRLDTRNELAIMWWALEWGLKSTHQLISNSYGVAYGTCRMAASCK